MNSIFSAQRSMVPIDSCYAGAQNSAFLQQASYITGGRCGLFGYCDQLLPHSCNCIRDFEPKVQAEWSKKNWTGGYIRKKKLRWKGDRFLRAEKMKLSDYSFTLGNTSLSDCYLECLKNCSCTTYTLSSANCLNWFGDLMDLLLNSLDGQDIYIHLHGSEQVGGGGEAHKSTNAKWLLIIALGKQA